MHRPRASESLRILRPHTPRPKKYHAREYSPNLEFRVCPKIRIHLGCRPSLARRRTCCLGHRRTRLSEADRVPLGLPACRVGSMVRRSRLFRTQGLVSDTWVRLACSAKAQTQNRYIQARSLRPQTLNLNNPKARQNSTTQSRLRGLALNPEPQGV